MNVIWPKEHGKLIKNQSWVSNIGLIRPPRTGLRTPGSLETQLKPYQKHAAPHPSFYQKVHPDNLFGNQFGEETHYNTWQTQPDNFDKPSHRFQPKPDAATYGQGMVHHLILSVSNVPWTKVGCVLPVVISSDWGSKRTAIIRKTRPTLSSEYTKLLDIKDFLNHWKKRNSDRNQRIKSQIFQNSWIISEISFMNNNKRTMKDFKTESTN